MELTMESVREACQEGGDKMIQLVKMVQMVMIGAFLSQDTDQYSDEECSAIICPKCSQLTFFSAKVMIPGFQFDRLCLADPCVEGAIRLLNTQQQQV